MVEKFMCIAQYEDDRVSKYCNRALLTLAENTQKQLPIALINIEMNDGKLNLFFGRKKPTLYRA